MKTFEELGLSNEVLKVIKEKGFAEPSEIQEKAIPLALAGKDIIGGSATGSGKTLVFAAPMIDNLKASEGLKALILTPTRELAEQVSRAITSFSKNKKLEVLAVYGGVGIENQIRKLRNVNIVVGTPGRILDHLNRQTIKLDRVKFLVLDEVDRMFDMGFQIDVEKIIKQCPKNRQTMLFSATISRDIDYLAKKHTKEAVRIVVNSYVDPSKLKQTYYDVRPDLKFSLLVHLLKKEKSDLVMVFCSTRRNVDFIAKNLAKLGINAKAIHGGLSQNHRTRVMEDFHGKEVTILVCTDIAARGLDIKDVSHIYNYDLPKTSNDYIHRIGRTARAGSEGKAVNILADRDYENFRNILKDDSLNIKREDLPEFEKVEARKFFDREDHKPKRNFSRFSRGPRREEVGKTSSFGRRNQRTGSFRRSQGTSSFGRRRHSENNQRYSRR